MTFAEQLERKRATGVVPAGHSGGLENHLGRLKLLLNLDLNDNG